MPDSLHTTIRNTLVIHEVIRVYSESVHPTSLYIVVDTAGGVTISSPDLLKHPDLPVETWEYLKKKYNVHVNLCFTENHKSVEKYCHYKYVLVEELRADEFDNYPDLICRIMSLTDSGKTFISHVEETRCC